MSKTNKLKLSMFSFMMMVFALCGLLIFTLQFNLDRNAVNGADNYTGTFTTGENDDIIVGCKYNIINENELLLYEITSISSAGIIDLNDFVDSVNADGGEYQLVALIQHLIDTSISSLRTKFTGIIIPSTVTQLDSVAGLGGGSNIFMGCSSLSSVIFEQNSKIIRFGYSLFSGCTSLTSITIPSSVVQIGYGAFSGCSSLQSVVFESNSHLTEIEDRAFSGCSSLTTISIPDSVIVIGGGVFDSCSVLSYLIIGENSKLKKIESSAFDGCTQLQYVDTANNFSYIKTTTNNYFYLRVSQSGYTGAAIVNSECKFIGSSAFRYCSSSSVTIPETLTWMSLNSDFIPSGWEYTENNLKYMKANNNNYFYLIGATNYNITSSVIHEGCKFIGDDAFDSCGKLTNVTIPNGVIGIGDDADVVCETIPDSVIYIGDNACKGLTHSSITLTGVKYIGDSAFDYCNNLTSITLSNVEYIGNLAFFSCDNLTSVVLSDNLTYMRRGVFRSCQKLTSVTMPENMVYIGESYGDEPHGAFAYCYKLSSIIIPNGIIAIGKNTFQHCGALASVTIPNSVIRIEMGAFTECDSLENLYYNGTLEEWCKVSIQANLNTGILQAASNHFYVKNNVGEYEEITELTIPSSMKYVKDYTFYGCGNITELTIHDQVTSIGDRAFTKCSGLTNLVLPESVSNIGYEAFYYCTSLNRVVINNSGSFTVDARGFDEGSTRSPGSLRKDGTGTYLYALKSKTSTSINGEYYIIVGADRPTISVFLTYNGSEQDAPTIIGFNDKIMKIEDNSELKGTEAKTYHIYISLLYVNYRWNDYTWNPDGDNILDITWTINPKSLNSDGNIVLNQDNVDYDGNDHSPQ